MSKAARATREELGLYPRSFAREVRWQLEDAHYPPAVRARMTPAELAFLSRFNREFHGGRFAGVAEGTDLMDLQVVRRERWNAKHAAERCIMSNQQNTGAPTDEMVGSCNPFED